jgi:hypothetical protein
MEGCAINTTILKAKKIPLVKIELIIPSIYSTSDKYSQQNSANSIESFD